MHNELIKVENDRIKLRLCYYRDYDKELLELAIKDAVEWLKFLMQAKRELDDNTP